MVEVASTTCADIIEEVLIDVICTPTCTPKIALGELIFYIINSISPKSDTFPSCERVKESEWKLAQLRFLHNFNRFYNTTLILFQCLRIILVGLPDWEELVELLTGDDGVVILISIFMMFSFNQYEGINRYI